MAHRAVRVQIVPVQCPESGAGFVTKRPRGRSTQEPAHSLKPPASVRCDNNLLLCASVRQHIVRTSENVEVAHHDTGAAHLVEIVRQESSHCLPGALPFCGDVAHNNMQHNARIPLEAKNNNAASKNGGHSESSIQSPGLAHQDKDSPRMLTVTMNRAKVNVVTCELAG
eukprot:6471696-Amphidinium_carterae.2